MRGGLIEPLDDEQLAALDYALLDSDGFFIPREAAHLKLIHPVMQAWAVKRARYQFVTVELVHWLKEQIGGRRAIEVAAGNGDIGHALGIPMTDSYMQTLPEIVAHYAKLGQPTISPPPAVEKLGANAAVLQHKPQVVIASWMTQKYLPGDERTPKINSSIYGADEVAIVDSVETYIHIGNAGSHFDKRALRRPHKVFAFDWLVSRAIDQRMNNIYVWSR